MLLTCIVEFWDMLILPVMLVWSVLWSQGHVYWTGLHHA